MDTLYGTGPNQMGLAEHPDTSMHLLETVAEHRVHVDAMQNDARRPKLCGERSRSDISIMISAADSEYFTNS